MKIENPFNTISGQIPVSQSENYLARLLRQGKISIDENAGYSVDGTETDTIRPQTPSVALYPTHLNIMSNVIANGYFEIDTGKASEDNLKYNFSLSAGESLKIDLPFGFYVLPAGTVKTTITAESGIITASVQGIEVSYNV